MNSRITDEHGVFLVKLAREAVEQNLREGHIIEPPEDIDSILLQPMGVFVTISSLFEGQKHLRGCIGFPYPTYPLAKAVVEAAIDSANRDPRFPRLTVEELEQVTFEVSVLTKPELVKVESPKEYPTSIEVGQDGLIIENGYFKGLLLPQVPVEWGWDEEEFLCQCCIKAGLSPDSWILRETKIYKFQCVIFEEKSPKGHTMRKSLEEA